MGFIKVRFGVFNPRSPDKTLEVEGIVDTGAIYSVIPRKSLTDLGIKPLERRRFRTFGGYIERDLGEAGMELLGRRRTVTVVMGDLEDQVVLGVTALESFGLEADPVRGTLKEAELLLL
ncbi:MAG: aspartyl protease [Candidatus Bathyarchaeia archaeon]